MALVTVVNAKGAPGCTTTAMLVAALWPRATILVDADPAGGDVALRLPDLGGRALDRDRGLLSLLPSARRGLSPGTVLEHVQTAMGGQPVVAGLAGPEQSMAVGPLWRVLADAFASVPGADVVVDAGQVHGQSPHLALLERSDLVLWVYRPTAWSVLHTRRRLEGLTDLVAESSARVGVVAVAPLDRETDVSSGQTALRQDWDWLVGYGAVAEDRKAVAMFEGGQVHRPERTMLARSGRTLVDAMYAELPAAAREDASFDAEDESDETPEDGELVTASAGKRRRRKSRRDR